MRALSIILNYRRLQNSFLIGEANTRVLNKVLKMKNCGQFYLVTAKKFPVPQPLPINYFALSLQIKNHIWSMNANTEKINARNVEKVLSIKIWRITKITNVQIVWFFVRINVMGAREETWQKTYKIMKTFIAKN